MKEKIPYIFGSTKKTIVQWDKVENFITVPKFNENPPFETSFLKIGLQQK